MSKLHLRLRALFQRRKLDAEMDEEMRSHIELQTQENIEAGMNPDAARYAALRQFGWVESIKETCRERRGVNWIEHLLQDFRYGLRMMRKNPGSTVIAVLLLALGIGGNTAVFSVVDKAILNPIPGKAADQMITLRGVEVARLGPMGVSPPLFAELASYTNTFESLVAMAHYGTTLTLDRGGTEIKLTGITTSPGFFDIFGVQPLFGHTFFHDEGRPGNDAMLVTSYGLWQRHFGGDPHLVGRTITLSGRSYTIVGIMPPTFQFPPDPEGNKFWLPHLFAGAESEPAMREARHWDVVGRLRDGVSLEQARALLETVAKRRAQDHPEANRKWTLEAKPARALFIGPTLERTLWSLQAAVLMLLLISCANVGTLLASQVAARRTEFSVRMAIGAGRSRVVRQLITESLVLAGIAALFGVFFAWGGIRALDYFYLENLLRLRTIGLDGSVLALTVLVSALTGLVFGVGPAWLVSRLRLSDSLKDAQQQQTGGFVQRQFQDGLVTLQVALAVVLLVGAGLMVHSMVKLLRVNPGFDPKGLYRVFFKQPFQFQNLKIDYEEAERRGMSYLALFREEVQRKLLWSETMVERLSAIPGIEAAAIYHSSGSTRADYRIEGREEPVTLSPCHIGIRSGDYFRALRVKLVAGRLLREEDSVPGQQTVVVNQEMARRYWPDESPLSKRFVPLMADGHRAKGMDCVVVGVIENVLDYGKEAPPYPGFYTPRERFTDVMFGGTDFIIRTSLNADSLRPILDQLAREMSSEGVADFSSLEEGLRVSTAPRRIYMWLLTAMGALGLLLSALGVYAVMAYAVVRRTREIGVRMALGATRGNIARLILGRGARLVFGGMVLGVVAAFIFSHYLESLLYQVKSGDVRTFVGVLLTLGAVAGIACYIPARRATRVNPMEALRYE